MNAVKLTTLILIATALIGAAILLYPAFALERSQMEIAGDRIIVIDGDTVALPCKPETGFVRGCAEKVRLKDIDTPEVSHPTCEFELQKGLEAKARLRELMSGEVVSIKRSGEIDRYGRTLGWLVLADSSDVGSILLQEGLALNWTPGSKAKAARIAHWCGGVSQ
ncbi:thermonuclease family protein [Phyllobacterium sp. P30BS-XVII]|uniref:thermonuclease family protein n=1 Tax=Phyllobacterium sp. P30BS-XVII TaxID=2587046 RepID=UPI0017BE362C|nr:thermonuclease family protein [Phyllobacterium sp. P30BS-XVII]MBA8904139.1 endonuclease YncB(thermonuclease family) [Phyllobacterium sp. P30BS-XVII]